MLVLPDARTTYQLPTYVTGVWSQRVRLSTNTFRVVASVDVYPETSCHWPIVLVRLTFACLPESDSPELCEKGSPGLALL